MSAFDSGVTAYVDAHFDVVVHFPVDRYGQPHINCSQCYYYSTSTNRCRLNNAICEFPNKYVGSNCPLEVIEK